MANLGTPISDPADPEVARARLEAQGLDRGDLDPDPFVQAQRWWEEAADAGIRLSETMALATATPEGRPSVRFVLLRGLDERGLVFYTNARSAKGDDLRANPVAAVVLAWHPISRQVRATGAVEPVTSEESDAYWVSRPRGSQLSAWASPQSRPVRDRAELEERLRVEQARWADRPVARPPEWFGWRIVPDEFEFWQGRADRFHDRFRYQRPSGGERGDRPSGGERGDRPSGGERTWTVERLGP